MFECRQRWICLRAGQVISVDKRSSMVMHVSSMYWRSLFGGRYIAAICRYYDVFVVFEMYFK